MNARYEPSTPGGLPETVRELYGHIREDLPELPPPPKAVVPWEFNTWFGAADYLIQIREIGPKDLPYEVPILLPAFARSMSNTFNLPLLETRMVRTYAGLGAMMQNYQAGTAGGAWCDIGGSLASMNILRSNSPHLEMECTHDPPHTSWYDVDARDKKLIKQP